MNIIINHSSMQPIYEQIMGQIKERIMHGELKEDTALPSVRTFAKELKVSALTVKKAYDGLEEEGFIVTVHGKGSFVACANQETMLEEKKREVEADLEMAIRKGRSCGMSDGKIVLHEETDRLLEEYGVLKVSKEQYQELDHTYILKKHKDTFGYRCLTDQKQFYQENYPGIVIEKGNIDELITIMIQGEKI